MEMPTDLQYTDDRFARERGATTHMNLRFEFDAIKFINAVVYLAGKCPVAPK
jgi:hypothetical protein